MKVFFVINSLKSKSGSERVACVLANKFSEILNCNVFIINRDTSKKNVAYELNENISVFNFSGSIFKFYKKTSELIDSESPEYIIIHNMGKLSILCSLINTKAKVISLEHGSFLGRPYWLKNISKFFYKRIDQVVVLTKKDKLDLDKINKNVVVIPNISPYPITKKITYPKIIVSIGRLDENKNHIHLLRAWEIIYKKIPDWTLYIYGEGELSKDLNKFIIDKSLNNVFLKGVSNDVSNVYKNSSIFAMTSKFEGLPMVLIEAQSFGLPIVAYDCPYGPSDIVESNYNGFLVDNQNILSMANSLLSLTTSCDLLRIFSSNSLERAKAFQDDGILTMWKDIVLEE